MDDARKALRAKLSERSKRALMHDRFILLKRHQDLSAQQLLLLESWLGQFPRLAAVYWRKEEFYQIYEARDLEEATARYIAWEERVAQRARSMMLIWSSCSRLSAGETGFSAISRVVILELLSKAPTRSFAP